MKFDPIHDDDEGKDHHVLIDPTDTHAVGEDDEEQHLSQKLSQLSSSDKNKKVLNRKNHQL